MTSSMKQRENIFKFPPSRGRRWQVGERADNLLPVVMAQLTESHQIPGEKWGGYCWFFFFFCYTQGDWRSEVLLAIIFLGYHTSLCPVLAVIGTV